MALAIDVCVFVEDADLEGGREFRSGAIALIRQLCSSAMVYLRRRGGQKDRVWNDKLNHNLVGNLEYRDSGIR